MVGIDRYPVRYRSRCIAPVAASSPAPASRRSHLHPHAAAWCGRLRGDGMSPLGAMRETVPLFGGLPTSASANVLRPGTRSGR